MSHKQLLGRSVLALMGTVTAVALSANLWTAAAQAAEGPKFDASIMFAPVPKLPQGKRGSLIDLTGTWVSIVNEDWRFRMVTPPKGDYEGVLLSPAGKKVANMWTPEMDGSCKAYGVGGLMRMPTRVKIGWEDDNTLKIETDAGVQTRRLLFTQAPASGPKTLQGYSVANWERLVPPMPPNPLGGSKPVTGGTLKVTTTNHTDGWQRRNGAPYSENAVITEYYDRWPGPDGSEWMSVTTVVDDPEYLYQRAIVSSHFRKEANDSKWNPKPCKAID